MRFYICSRMWNGRTWYAQNLPGDGGVDWGYTDVPGEVLPLSTYWMRRFIANGKACGDKHGPWAREVASESCVEKQQTIAVAA